MGWWAGEGDDVIGDGPADILTGMFKKIAASYDSRGKARPAIEDMLDSLLTALGIAPERILVDAGTASFNRLTATLEPGSITVSSREPLRVDDDLVSVLRAGIEAVTADYEEDVERKPRLSEMLGSFAFVLGYRPEDYLSGMEGKSVAKLTVAKA